MMIEKSGTIRLKDIHIPQGGTPEQQELAQGMVRVNHLYRSALKVAVTQLEILDEEFASLYPFLRIHIHKLPCQNNSPLMLYIRIQI